MAISSDTWNWAVFPGPRVGGSFGERLVDESTCGGGSGLEEDFLRRVFALGDAASKTTSLRQSPSEGWPLPIGGCGCGGVVSGGDAISSTAGATKARVSGGGGLGLDDDLDDYDFSSIGKLPSGASCGTGGGASMGGSDFPGDSGDPLGGGVSGCGGDDFESIASSGKGAGVGKGKAKGKGKKSGKDGEKGEKGGKDGLREPNPKNLFFAGVADAQEHEIRSYFEKVGEVDRLKILRNTDGTSKGIGFVTFRQEDKAQKALRLHGKHFEGRPLTVRLAHGGNKGEKGQKGQKGEKGGKGDRVERDGGDFGGGVAFDDLAGTDREPSDTTGFKPACAATKRQSKATKTPKINWNELNELLEEVLADLGGPLQPADFDFTAKRFLLELRSRDRADNSERFIEALDMIFEYTGNKKRCSVRKWPAYIFSLLQKFDPNLWAELRKKQRVQAGGGKAGQSTSEKEARGSSDTVVLCR
eukprot:TRINITY_DN16110_c0_g1_i1.p1 TRINITY_DN16110_c0_g1~~TRINITY_DN16110_c0_g1_i1.p1  ORF type:complete len:472 (-),score=100.00 TRINITY_DN16110_c0_g1_i1:28-1443(-)